MKWLLIASVLSGCWSLPFIHRNVNVYDRQKTTSITFDEMRIVIDYALDKLGNRGLFNNYDFVFTSAYFAKMRADGSVEVGDGLTGLKRKVIYLKVRDKCFADVGIIHEMGHVIYAGKHGDLEGDCNHTDKKWWAKIDNLNEQMVKDLCPPDYVRNDLVPTGIESVDTTN